MDSKQHVTDQKMKGALSTGLGFAIAMTLGATLGILFAPKEGAQTQKDIMKKAENLAKKFNKNREDLQKTVKNIFGEISEELERNYLELQGDILAAWDDIQNKAERTQKKYDAIVNEKTKEFSDDKKWSQKVIKNLKEDFTKAWGKLNAE